MTPSLPIPRRTPDWKLVLLKLVFAYLVALKLWFSLTVTPMGDEAYYWMWGQHLSWSYFDHPPLQGWLLGLVAALFGWSTLSVRLLTWVSFGGTLAILWLWSGRLAPDDRDGWFWHTVVIYLSMPVIFVMTSFAFHDHLLLFFVIASAYFFHGFAGDWEEGRGSWRGLYVAAVLLGLAVLTKYNGVFLGLGYAVWVVVRPGLRRLLLTPHLWLAALLAVAMQAPVLYWNLTEGFASIRFHLADRPSLDWTHPQSGQVLSFLATMVLMMSPVVFLSLVRVPFLGRANPAWSRATGLAAVTYLGSTLVWTGLSAYVVVFLHWNIVAYAALIPILYAMVGGGVRFVLHVALGLYVATLGTLMYTIAPTSILGFSDPGAAANYGWQELARKVADQQLAHPGSFLAATRYTYAAQLGFQLHDIDVAAFNPVRSQNDYWWDAKAHAGKDAIIVADRAFPITDAQAHFALVERLDTLEVVRQGTSIWTFEIWLGRSYDAR